MTEIRVYPDPSALVHAAAGQIVTLAAAAIARRGVFCIMFSGGSTPRALHQRLTESDFSGKLDWRRVQVFWGDERCVPSDHRDSNYRMAKETLLDHVPIPPQNIHRIHGELNSQEAADQYELELRQFFRHVDNRSIAAQLSIGDLPIFDLVLLGMGGDGHTASLFPGSSALKEKVRWVAAIEHLKPPPPLVSRITVTPIVINPASQVIFLVAGASKADRLRQVLDGPYQPELLPAQVVRPEGGKLLWMVDEAAAANLKNHLR